MTDDASRPWPADIVDRYERPLLAYAGRMLGGDWQAAQDAVQETFLRLCRADRDQIESRVAAWLFSVCRSRVIDMRRTKRAVPLDAATATILDPSPPAPEAICEDEDKRHLAELITGLSPRQQEVLRLRLQAGLSYREIAEVTGMTVGNVGFHLHEAVRNLRRTLSSST